MQADIDFNKFDDLKPFILFYLRNFYSQVSSSVRFHISLIGPR